jgi:mannose-6-phosphate isomerase-like protein (cupin superfamily)
MVRRKEASVQEYVIRAENGPALVEVREEEPGSSWRGVAKFLDVWVDREAAVTGVIWDYEGVIDQTASWTELVVIVDGEADFDIDGKSYDLKKGDFVIWPKGMHGVMTTRGWLRTVCIAYPFVRGDDYRVNLVDAAS